MQYINSILQYLNSIPTYQITNIWILLGIALPVAAFNALWRRTYGGGFIADWWESNKWVSWFNIRFLCTLIELILVFSICQWVRGLQWYYSIYISVVIMGLYWALAHGPWFDIGGGGMPDEKMLKRYNKVWFAPILNLCFPEGSRYTAFYDTCGMLIRYTWPLLLIFWIPTFNSGLLFLGTLVMIVYGVCYTLKAQNKINYGGSDLSEWIVGAITGLYLVLLGMI